MSKTTAPKPPSYRLDGKKYDLTVREVAEFSGRGDRWVYTRAASLGGIKRAWDPSKKTMTIRFPSVGLKKRLKDMGL